MSERLDNSAPVQPSRQLRSSSAKEQEKISAQKLFNVISRTIAEATESTLLTYENVDPSTGSLVTLSLKQDKRVERVRPR